MAAVFDALLSISINSLWVILAVLAVRWLLRNQAKSIRMLLWALVALRLLIPFTPESKLSLIPEETVIELSTDEKTDDVTVNSPVIPDVNNNTPVTVNPTTDNDGGQTESHSNIQKPQTLPPVSFVEPNTEIVSGNTVADVAGVAEKTVEGRVSPKEIALILWAVGVFVLLAYHTVSYIILRVRLKDAYRTEGNVWRSDRIPGAFSFGIIKPKIYVPAFINAQDAEYIIAHERSHISHGDHIYKALALTLTCVYWFNPLVWVSYILFCRDMEFACDERVIRGKSREEVKEYSRILVNCSSANSINYGGRLAFNMKDVKKRIANVLNYKQPGLWLIITCVLLSVVIVVCFMTVPAEREDNLEDDVIALDSMANTSEFTEPSENINELTEPDLPTDNSSPTEPTPTEPAPTETVHLEHSFMETSRIEPTCTKNGVILSACSVCGEETSEKLPATGHAPVAATCEVDGTCASCGTVLEEAFGHSMLGATCVEGEKCSQCGYTSTDPLGHTFLYDGVDVSCQDCGAPAYSFTEGTTFDLYGFDDRGEIHYRITVGDLKSDKQLVGYNKITGEPVNLVYTNLPIVIENCSATPRDLSEIASISYFPEGSSIKVPHSSRFKQDTYISPGEIVSSNIRIKNDKNASGIYSLYIYLLEYDEKSVRRWAFYRSKYNPLPDYLNRPFRYVYCAKFDL